MNYFNLPSRYKISTLSKAVLFATFTIMITNVQANPSGADKGWNCTKMYQDKACIQWTYTKLANEGTSVTVRDEKNTTKNTTAATEIDKAEVEPKDKKDIVENSPTTDTNTVKDVVPEDAAIATSDTAKDATPIESATVTSNVVKNGEDTVNTAIASPVIAEKIVEGTADEKVAGSEQGVAKSTVSEPEPTSVDAAPTTVENPVEATVDTAASSINPVSEKTVNEASPAIIAADDKAISTDVKQKTPDDTDTVEATTKESPTNTATDGVIETDNKVNDATTATTENQTNSTIDIAIEGDNKVNNAKVEIMDTEQEAEKNTIETAGEMIIDAADGASNMAGKAAATAVAVGAATLGVSSVEEQPSNETATSDEVQQNLEGNPQENTAASNGNLKQPWWKPFK